MQHTEPAAVVIGDALIDEIHDARGTRELVGGAAVNVAVGMRRLGVPVTLIAMVGDDLAGEHIRTYLADHGVHLRASPAPLGSSRARVRRGPGGEPQYVFNRAAQQRSIRFGAPERAAIDSAALTVVSCFPFDAVAEVEALADAVAGRRLAIDPNPRAGMLHDRAAFVRGFERLAQTAELVKIGEDDVRLLYGAELTSVRLRLRQAGARGVLATAGADGATFDTEAATVTSPIIPLPGAVIDTVGAGDATLAAVAVGLLRQPPRDPSEVSGLLERAMSIAAATCRAEGGLLRTPESLRAAAESDGGS